MKYIIIICSFIFLTAFSCEDENVNEDYTRIFYDVDSKVSISQGIYGLTYSVNDVGNTDAAIIENFKILIFTINDTATTLLDSIHSDNSGFYEYELEPGEYKLCSGFMRCATLTINNRLKRCDYEFSVGPGWTCGEYLFNE